MTDQLTATGLEVDDLETRLAAVRAQLRTEISAILDTSDDLALGQLTRLLTAHVQTMGDLLQAIFDSADPDVSTGASLTALSLITGTQRRAATHGHVQVDVNLDAGRTVPAGTLFAVVGDPTNQWALDDDVTSVGAGWYGGTATAVIGGPYQALAATITVIVVPVAGLNAVTNGADATPGLPEETDAELRERRELEVTQGGSGSTDSVRAALLEVDGVIEARCDENDTDFAADRLGPHSLGPVIWDGAAPAAADADVAAAIFANKASGVPSVGDTSVNVVDAQGTTHAIGFTRGVPRDVGVEFTLTTDGDYPGDPAFIAAMVQLAQEQFSVGDDLMVSKWVANAFTVPGVVEVTLLRTALDDPPAAPLPPGTWAVTNRVLDSLEIAVLDAANVIVL